MSFEEQLSQMKTYIDDALYRALLSDIDEKFISKQRVKEAIKKCVKIYEDEDGEYPDMMDSEMLLKELGLED